MNRDVCEHSTPVDLPCDKCHVANRGGHIAVAMSRIADLEAQRDALAEPEEDPELSAALGWAAGISEPVLDRKALLRRVAEIATDMQAKTKRAWDVGYDCGLKAASERRLSDSEIGEIWFAAKIPGLTETQARVLIRAAERRLLEDEQ